MSVNLKIVKADGVAELYPETKEMLAMVVEYFDLKNEVVLQETTRGHISIMKKNEICFVPGEEGKPAQFKIEQLRS